MFDYQETMDRLLEQEVKSGKVKGSSALVLQHGKELYYNQFGFADAEKQIPMKRDTIIHLYSMSKPITAAAVMILAERGELDLWDPVSQYLPWYRDCKVWEESKGLVALEREIKIFDLLNMTSGITYPDESTKPGREMKQLVESFVARRDAGEWVDTLEYAKGIASIPLVFQPGDRWMYGFSADVLGAVVEVVSGKKFGKFLQEELFEPLAMTDTGFGVPKEKRERLAQYYEVNGEGKLVPHVGSHLGEYYGEQVAFESGGAGLVSTLDDYSHFAMMMVQKGMFQGKRILGAKTVEFMTKNHLTKEQMRTYNWDSTKGQGYGCLMRVLIDQSEAASNASLGEHGWDGWTGNYVTMSPKDGLVILYFIQLCGAGMTTNVRKIKMATYASLEEEE